MVFPIKKTLQLSNKINTNTLFCEIKQFPYYYVNKDVSLTLY